LFAFSTICDDYIVNIYLPLPYLGQLLTGSSEECLSNLGKADPVALNAYSRLHDLSIKFPALQDAAEGAAPHLADHITRTTQDLHKKIEKAFSTQFEAVLKKMSWPTPGMTVPISIEVEFRECARKLLDLQKPELESKDVTSQSSKTSPLVLLPLRVMVKPLELGFKYHFDGDKPTNRLDRPEYFLSHITDKVLTQYSDFMANNLQPILLDEFRGSDLALNAAYIDATSAFITALLPMVRAKIFAILPKVSAQPQLLSHLIHEVMSFDATIRDDWRYDAGNGDDGWRGLAYEILATDDWFKTWLNVEKECTRSTTFQMTRSNICTVALARYKEITDSPDNFELDYDSFGPGSTKPTKASIRLNDLLETTTEHYRTLYSFNQKLRFLLDIQISIFDLFHQRLHEGLEAYLTRTTRMGRTSREEQASLQGVAGLESLCRVYGSAEYLEKAMRDWSDDVFFLELWTELQIRSPRTPTSADEDATASGALFDETATAYQRLRVRCENIIMDLVNHNIRTTLTAYVAINPWATLQQAQTQIAPLPPTAELDKLIGVLGSHFGFLAKALGKVPLRKVARSAAGTVDTVLFDQVLLRHSFSASGALQFSSDITAILSTFEKFIGQGVAEFGLARVSEGSALVGLPIMGSKNDDDVDMDMDEDDEDDVGNGNGKKRLGLWQVEKRMFESSGDEARACLRELGFERLSVAEGRKVLAKRVELGA
jgi:hypothetical protein